MSKSLLKSASELVVTKLSGSQNRKFSAKTITVAKPVSEEFFRRTKSFYKFSDNVAMKPFSEKEAFYAHQELNDVILKHDPRMLDALQEAKEEDHAVTIVKGIELPEVKKSDVPRFDYEAAEQSFMRMIRPAEAAISAYSIALGFLPDDHIQGKVTGCVFATEAQAFSQSSFQSDQKLAYHNDGWGIGNAMPYIVLMGLLGHKNARTQILPCSDIVNYLRENGREKYLEILNQDSYIEDYSSEFSIPLETVVLDSKTNKINFAEYGSFTPRSFSDGKMFYEGISFLRECLDKIPPIDLNIQRELVKINNAKSLHRKVPDPSFKGNSVESFITNRLLLRFLGSSEGSESFRKLIKCAESSAKKDSQNSL